MGVRVNKLFYGDNLEVLRGEIASESIDLIYLDPPFNSNANYNILFKSKTGDGSDAQIEAFEDTWHWTDHRGGSEDAFDEVMRSGLTGAAELLRAMRGFLGENDMMAYLAMMAIRLIELHRVLKPTGSLYLHCDPTASHYLKLLLDGVFGAENFRNEIIWRRSGSHNSVTKQYGPIHDVILFYAKDGSFRLNSVLQPHNKAYVEGEFRYEDSRGAYRLNEIMAPETRAGDSGKPWQGYDPTPRGRHWAIPEALKKLLPNGGAGLTTQQQLDALHALDELYVSPAGRPKYKQRPTEGVGLQDIWAFQPGTNGALYESAAAIDEDVKWLSNEAEKLGYPTQKPVGLLERIILSSTKADAVVLDPFCGCGTAVHAAQKLGRQWIGIDITHLAISLIEKRMKDAFPGIEFEVHGTPKDLASAQDLAARDKYQFQWWAVSMVDALPFGGKKKGADGGIDGIIYFKPDGKRTEKALVSVKGGSNVSVNMIRDLHSAMEREKAPIGVFITSAMPTRPMETEAAAVGRFHAEATDKSYPRLQIITLAELFQGKKPDIPYVDPASIKRAKREDTSQQGQLI